MEERQTVDVRLILGSPTDAPNGNLIIPIFQAAKIRYDVSFASCHRDAGEDFNTFVNSIDEKIIAFLGGMELAAPGCIASMLRNSQDFNKIVFAIPTDKAARSAIENLPEGTAVITCGLNETSPKHSIKNSGLAIAQMAYMLGHRMEIRDGLIGYYEDLRAKKPLIYRVELEANGLIPV